MELLRSGDADAALALLRDDQTMGQLIRIDMLRFQRQYQRAIDLLASMPERAFSDAGVPGRSFWAGSLQYAAGRRAEALPLLQRAAADSQRAVGAFPPGSSRGGEFWFACSPPAGFKRIIPPSPFPRVLGRHGCRPDERRNSFARSRVWV